MVLSVADAVTSVRERLNEATTSLWSDVMLRRWLNEGIKDIGRRTFHYTDTSQVAVVANTSEYTMAANIMRINLCYFVQTGDTRMLPMTPKQWESMDRIWMSQQNTFVSYPVFFATRGYSPQVMLKIFPVPTTSGTLHLHFARMPADINIAAGGGNVDCPDFWVQLALDYCEYMALRRDRDPRWQEAKGLYEEKMQDMIDNGDYLNARQEVLWEGPYAYDRWLVDPSYAGYW